MARYFRFPWAVAGDKTTIPDTTQTDGAVSYQEGYGDPYEQDPATTPGARNIEREMYNQALFDVTSTLQQYYQQGVPDYITPAENGGTAYGYPIYARVRLNNRVYESLIANNTNAPTVTSAWRLADFLGLDARYLQQTGADARYLLEANNLSDLISQSTARSNLGLGTAATRNTGTASDQVPLNSQLPTLGTAATLDVGQDSGDIPQIGTPATAGRSAVVINAGSNSNGGYRIYSDGFIEQWSVAYSISPGQTLTRNWPISFSNRCDFAVCEDINRNDSVLNISFSAQPTTTQFRPSNSGGGSTKRGWTWGIGS